MKIGNFTKTPVERKRYAIDYSNWLDVAETLVSVIFTATPTSGTPITPIIVDASSFTTGNTVLVYFVSFGDLGINYILDVRITTSAGQVKEDTVSYSVKSA